MALTRTTPLRRTPLQRGTALAHEGRRGRRLRSGDRKVSAEVDELTCVCGDHPADDPAHLWRRNIASTRHEAWNVLPACRMVHTWLDATVEGVQARRVLRQMAQEKGDRLTADECRAVILPFYAWLTKARCP